MVATKNAGKVLEAVKIPNGVTGLLYNFDLNSDRLKDGHKNWLRNRLGDAPATGRYTLYVHGRASKLGSKKYNEHLSEKRAKAVRDFLVRERGALANRIVVKWVGEDEAQFPVDDELDRAVWVGMRRTSDATPWTPPPIRVPTEVDDPRPAKFGQGRWIGVGVKAGVHAFIGGADALVGYVESQDPGSDSSFWLDIWNARIGPGAGKSVGAVLILVNGVYHPDQLSHLSLSGADFQLSGGFKFGSVLKTLGEAKPLIRIAEQGKKLFNELNTTAMRNVIAGMKADVGLWTAVFAEPHVMDVRVIDIPLAGFGVEASIYLSHGGCDAYRIRTKAP